MTCTPSLPGQAGQSGTTAGHVPGDTPLPRGRDNRDTPLGVSRSDVPVPGGVRGLLPGVPEQGAGQAQCPGAGGEQCLI